MKLGESDIREILDLHCIILFSDGLGKNVHFSPAWGENLFVLQLLHSGRGGHRHGDDDVIDVKGTLSSSSSNSSGSVAVEVQGCGGFGC